MLRCLLLFLALQASAATKPDESFVRIYEKNERSFIEICKPTENPNKPKCESLGNPAGYSREKIRQWQGVERATSLQTAPAMLGVGIIALGIGLVVMAPPAGIVALLMGGTIFSVTFFNHPETKSGMPSRVYAEFMDRPDMVPELKKYLCELDAGAIVDAENARVLSRSTEIKNETSAQGERPDAKNDEAAPKAAE